MPREKKALLHQRQQELLMKFQNNTITEDEKDELTISLRGIVVNLAKKFQPSFARLSIDELISHGLEAMFFSFRKYDHTRARPSTFVHRVVQTKLMKEWHKEKNRHFKIPTQDVDDKGRKIKRICPTVSLNQYTDEHGDINELSHNDPQLRLDELHYRESLQLLYDRCCKDITSYNIISCFFNSELFRNVRGKKPKQIINRIAKRLGTTSDTVEEVIGRMTPFVDDNLIKMTPRVQFSPPKFVGSLNIDMVDVIIVGSLDAVDFLEPFRLENES